MRSFGKQIIQNRNGSKIHFSLEIRCTLRTVFEYLFKRNTSSFQVHRDNSKVAANFSCVFKLKAVKHPQIYGSSENVTLVTIVPFYKVLVVCFSQRKKKSIYTITKKLVN